MIGGCIATLVAKRWMLTRSLPSSNGDRGERSHVAPGPGRDSSLPELRAPQRLKREEQIGSSSAPAARPPVFPAPVGRLVVCLSRCFGHLTRWDD